MISHRGVRGGAQRGDNATATFGFDIMPSMRKRIAAKSTRIPPVKLYREDIVELVALLQQYCKAVEISDDKCIYESLTEACEKTPSPISNVEIMGKTPNIKLSLQRTGSWLTQVFEKPEMEQKDLDQLDVVYYRVKDFLDARRGTISHYFGGPVVTLSGLLIIAVVGITLSGKNPGGHGGLISFLAWVIALAWLVMNRTLRTDIGMVSLKPKAEVTSFWSRNKDAVNLVVIGAVLGAAGTLLVEWLKTFFVSK
jgi:hypothetical protein